MTSSSRPVALRPLGAVLILAGLFLGLLSTAVGAQPGDVARIDIVELRGPIDRPAAAHLAEIVERAQTGNVEAVVVQLDSPGALRADTEALVAQIERSRVPVVIWVGPPGARAGGAAAQLAASAHLLGLSPGATLGPAAPADLRDDIPADRGPTYLVVPAAGGAQAEAAAAAREGVTPISESQAVEQGLADFVVASLPDVLRELDGRQVALGALAAHTLTVDPVEAHVVFNNMGLWSRILHAVADPALAYLLIVAGALAIAFELYQPGFGVAGGSGALLFALGVYGLWVLPTNWLAFAVLVAGLAILSVDLSLGGLGLLTLAGAAAVTGGSLWLFDAPPELGLSNWLVAFVVASAVGFFVVVMTMVLRAQGTQAQEGAERVVGKFAVVRSMLNPEGHVFVDGALWRARAPEGAGKVKTGTRVHIVGLDDRLTLEVELADAPADAAAAAPTQ